MVGLEHSPLNKDFGLGMVSIVVESWDIRDRALLLATDATGAIFSPISASFWATPDSCNLASTELTAFFNQFILDALQLLRARGPMGPDGLEKYFFKQADFSSIYNLKMVLGTYGSVGLVLARDRLITDAIRPGDSDVDCGIEFKR